MSPPSIHNIQFPSSTSSTALTTLKTCIGVELSDFNLSTSFHSKSFHSLVIFIQFSNFFKDEIFEFNLIRNLFTSEITGISTILFLPISSVSISTWTTFASGLKVLPQPIYKLNLTPNRIIKSDSDETFLKAFIADGLACPKQFLWRSETIPLPKFNVYNGISCDSISCSNSFVAPEYHAPLPATIIGLDDEDKALRIFSMSSSDTSGFVGNLICGLSKSSKSDFSYKTSWGKPR